MENLSLSLCIEVLDTARWTPGEDVGWLGYAPLSCSHFFSDSGIYSSFLTPTGQISPRGASASFTFVLTHEPSLARFGVVTPILMHAVFTATFEFLGGLISEMPRTVPLSFDMLLVLSGLVIAPVVIFATKGYLGYSGTPIEVRTDG